MISKRTRSLLTSIEKWKLPTPSEEKAKIFEKCVSKMKRKLKKEMMKETNNDERTDTEET